MLVLYHGTDEKSAKSITEDGIDLYSGSLHTDFGPGFYTTPDFDLAKIWAKRKGVFSRGAVVSYRVDEGLLERLSVRQFVNTDLIWAQFIANNRNGFRYVRKMEMQENNLTGQYDIVIGQIADGKVSDITRYLQEDGLAVDEDVLCELRRKEYPMQYSFHTPKGIKLLTEPRIRLI